MTRIELILDGSVAHAGVKGALVAGMVNVAVDLKWSKDWEGLEKRLVCCSGVGKKTVAITGATAIVDPGILQRSSEANNLLFLGVEGYDTDGKICQISTMACCGRICPGSGMFPPVPEEEQPPVCTEDTEIRCFYGVNDVAADYLDASADYAETDHSQTVIDRYVTSGQVAADIPGFTTIQITEHGTLYLLDEQTGWCYSREVPVGIQKIVNLVPGHIYRWFVKDAEGSICCSGRLQQTGALRMIHFSGIRNVRDLGGWDCDGGKIKYGLIYRGGSLETENDLQAFEVAKQLGIRLEVDLRSGAGASSLKNSAIRYVPCPLSKTYRQALETGGTVGNDLVKALRSVMEAVRYEMPVYCHGAMGAGRTETICYLLKGLLGISAKNMDRDHELSSFYPGGRIICRRTDSEYRQMISYLQSLSGNSLRDKIVGWFLQAGFSLEELNAFRHAMIDGTPKPIQAPVWDGETTNYSITRTLQNCICTSSQTTIPAGQPLRFSILANDGYRLSSLTVTMGGVNVTASVVSGNEVSIASVTGHVLIRAIAEVIVVDQTQKFRVGDHTYTVDIGTTWQSFVVTPALWLQKLKFTTQDNGDSVYVIAENTQDGAYGAVLYTGSPVSANDTILATDYIIEQAVIAFYVEASTTGSAKWYTFNTTRGTTWRAFIAETVFPVEGASLKEENGVILLSTSEGQWALIQPIPTDEIQPIEYQINPV